MKRIALVMAVVAALVSGSARYATSETKICYVGLFADEGHSDCDVVYQSGIHPFDMWVYRYPIGGGMRAAEFAIAPPSNFIAGAVTANPAIAISIGNILDGTSVAFGTCQTEWVWSHHEQCYLFNLNSIEPSCVEIVSHPSSYIPGWIMVDTCDGPWPFFGATRLTNLYLNQDCVCPPAELVKIIGVTVTSRTSIRALFNRCVVSGAGPRDLVLRNGADATDSISAVRATWIYDNAYDLVLEEAMVDGTTYTLYARSNAWDCSHYYFCDSEFDFVFSETVGTKETSWGAIKALFK